MSYRLRLSLGMSFGAVSAILSAHSLLVAKSAVELLVRTIVDRHNQFKRFQSWLILLALLSLALTQLFFMHKGLRLVSTSILYPFVFCIYNIIAILDGLIYFHQTDRLPPLHAGLIALGTVILLAGVLALSWRLGEDPEEVVAPPDAHNLLTPGMGIIEDANTDDEFDGTPSTTPDEPDYMEADNDEESAIAHTPSERSPLLKKSVGWRFGSLRTPRTRRKRAATAGTSDVLDALEDRPSSRRGNTFAAFHSAYGTSGGAIDSSEDDDDDRPSSPLTARGMRRAKTIGSGAAAGVSQASRDKRRRRWSSVRSRRSTSVSSPLASRFVAPEPEREAANRRVGSLSAVVLDWWRNGNSWFTSSSRRRPADEAEQDDEQDTPDR